MKSQTGIITMDILSNISRNKGNQAIWIKKFRRVIEYNSNIFLEKSYLNVMEKLVPDPSLKIQNWAYPRINSLKLYIFCFYCMS